MSAVKAYVTRSGRRLTHATLFRIEGGLESALNHVVTRCKGLKYLKLHSIWPDDSLRAEPFRMALSMTTNVKTFIVSLASGIRLDTVDDLLAGFSSLEHLELHNIYGSGERGVLPPTWSGELSRLRILKLNQAEHIGVTTTGLNLVGLVSPSSTYIPKLTNISGYSVSQMPTS